MCQRLGAPLDELIVGLYVSISGLVPCSRVASLEPSASQPLPPQTELPLTGYIMLKRSAIVSVTTGSTGLISLLLRLKLNYKKKKFCKNI